MSRLTALTLLLLTGFFPGTSAAREPSLEDALAASPYDLAISYLGASAAGMLSELARSGITIHTPDAVITAENADQFSTANEARAALYAEAIRQRGYRDLSGQYTGNATKACANIQSMWASLIWNGEAVKIKITQDEFAGQLGIATADAPDKMFENPLAVVEDTVAVIDFLNSDYFFQGTIDGDTITLRPDLASLKSWPSWINPPSKKNMKKCQVILEKIR